MRIAVALLIFMIVSCAQRADVQTPPTKPPVYSKPVKGNTTPLGRGVFINSRCGDYVRSVADGKVTYAGKGVGSYGWIVIVDQEDGFTSVYGKFGEVWVKTGERVKARQVLGRTGRYHNICGIYYELRDAKGVPIEPVMR